MEATMGRSTIGDNSPVAPAPRDSSKSSSTSSSNNGDDATPIKNTPELEDEVSRRTEQTASQRKDLAIKTSQDRASKLRK